MSKFVIHKHEAQKAGWHHDLRLERNGVLKSWAVPKGVPVDQGNRRVAIPVEDHDLKYGKFEGNIPEGQYGAGKVSIWDSGTYEASFWGEKRIELTFHGKRVNGEYMLHWIERMNSWLLWKR